MIPTSIVRVVARASPSEEKPSHELNAAVMLRRVFRSQTFRWAFQLGRHLARFCPICAHALRYQPSQDTEDSRPIRLSDRLELLDDCRASRAPQVGGETSRREPYSTNGPMAFPHCPRRSYQVVLAFLHADLVAHLSPEKLVLAATRAGITAIPEILPVGDANAHKKTWASRVLAPFISHPHAVE